MNYFVIGDVHGCYFTLMEMLKHWNSEKEYLVFVGDLIDRGNFSSMVVKTCYELSKHRNSVFIKGNHELEFIEYFENDANENWLNQCGQKTIDDFNLNKIDYHKTSNWFKNMPLKFETKHFIITHAGISETNHPFDENNMNGVLWNRKKLKNMNKVQIHGHTPLYMKKPAYNEQSNSWNIDAGAFYGFGLIGIKINDNGKVINTIMIETDKRDIEQ